MTLKVPSSFLSCCPAKGSVAVDGVSLTVAARHRARGSITVALIPYTRRVTTLGKKRAGDRVNLEIDVVARYVESIMGYRRRR